MVRLYLTNFQQLSTNVKLFLLGNAIQGVGLSIYGLLFNLYLKELGYGETAIGGLISTTSLGISLVAIPAALIIEKIHVKHMVATAMLFSSIFYFIQVTNVNESSLFTFGLLASMFQALFNISISPFYLRNSTPEVRVHLFSLNTALNMGAHFVGYLLGGYLPEVMKFFFEGLSRVEVYRASLFCAVSFIFLSNIVFMQVKKVPIPKMSKKIFEGVKEREWRMLIQLILPRLGLAIGGGLIIPFMNIYLKETFHLSVKSLGVAYAFLQLSIFLGVFMTPAIVRKTSQFKFMQITTLLSVPFMFSMGIINFLPLVLVCFFIRGTLMSMSGSITSVFEMEKVREKDCAFASAIILFCYHTVYTMSTRLGGLLIENYSFKPTFLIAGSFYIVSVLLYKKFFGLSEKARLQQLEKKVEELPPVNPVVETEAA